MNAGTIRILVITGAPGAGKTETARQLIELCPDRSALIDTDAVVHIHPWRIDRGFYALVGANLRACIENYSAWGAQVIVISGVVMVGGIYDEIAPLLDDSRYAVVFYGLRAEKKILTSRIIRDSKMQDAEQRLQWLHLNDELNQIPGCHVVETSNLEVGTVANMIAENEGLISRTSKEAQEPEENIQLPLDFVESTCKKRLEELGAPPEIALLVVRDLIVSEIEGHISHGLLRLPEYIAAIKTGLIKPSAEPIVKSVSRVSSMVDGQGSFGVLVAEKAREELRTLLAVEPIATIGITNSNHIGRLAHLVRPLCDDGYIVMGFVNYLGAGQKVPPWGGSEARFCTNPLVFGIPTASGEPMIIDMTTSVVSEGAIRSAAMSGTSVPEGWLIDKTWNTVTDPKRLYFNPPTAFIAPLGGTAGYKGYALALVVETLAGIVTGAGYSKAGCLVEGNGGFFVGMRSTILGRSREEVTSDLKRLIDYCLECPPAVGFDRIRIPGHPSAFETEPDHRPVNIAVNAGLWRHILTYDQTLV